MKLYGIVNSPDSFRYVADLPVLDRCKGNGKPSLAL